jgi:hypothetical protein
MGANKSSRHEIQEYIVYTVDAKTTNLHKPLFLNNRLEQIW